MTDEDTHAKQADDVGREYFHGPELERFRRIEAAARRLDHAYGPRAIGMIWTATQEMIDAWRELQEALES